MRPPYRLPLLLCFAALPVLLLWNAAAAADAVRGALRLCAVTLIPSLFPFSVAARLLLSARGSLPPGRRAEALMRRLFALPGSAALPLLLGVLGGFPIGAQCAAELRERGALTPEQAQRLCALSNHAGPAFLLGAAGLTLFGSLRAGLLLWLVQLSCACAACRVLPCPALSSSAPEKPAVPEPPAAALPSAVRRAADGMLLICGFVCFFAALLAPLQPLLSRLPCAVGAVLGGALELTGGLFRLAPLPPPLRFVCASGLLGWGGLCVHLQSLCFLQPAGLRGAPYLRAKAVQAALALPVSAAAVLLWKGPDPALWPPALGGLAAGIAFFLFFRQNSGKVRRSLL